MTKSKKGKRSINNLQNATHKAKHRATNTNPLKLGANLGAPEGWVVADPHVAPVVLLLLHPGGKSLLRKYWTAITTNGAYPWSFVTQTFRNGQPIHGGYRKTFKVITST